MMTPLILALTSISLCLAFFLLGLLSTLSGHLDETPQGNSGLEEAAGSLQ
jgi:hypothetical protein